MSASFFAMIGGALGAVCRYALGLWIMRLYSHPPIPIAMLIVNGLGSIVLGFITGTSVDEHGFILFPDQAIMLFLSVGFCGAFTTFSTFSVEAIGLWQQGRVKAFAAYISLTVLASIIGLILGIVLSGFIF